MAKFAEKNVLDYRLGGDTLSDFAQKYIAEIPRIYQFLNNLRTHDSNGTEQVEPEPYQIKVEDDKFYVRNKANDAWVYLFDAAKNGGMRSDSFGKQSAGSISSRPDTGNSAGDLFWDTDSGKVYMWLSDKWQLLLSLNITDLTGYDNVLTKSNLTIPTTGEVTSEPNKIPQTNENGVLPVNILGNAAKMAGINVEVNNLTDGQVFTYRAASNSWRNEDKGVVGAGKSLVLTDNGTQLADYSGDEHIDLDIGATIDTHISTHNSATDAHDAMTATIVDTLAPTSDEDTVRNLLSELANMVKANKGTDTWRDSPATTLATLSTLIGNLASGSDVTWEGNKFTNAKLGITGLMEQNGYICFGKNFGGLILQWGFFAMSKSPTKAPLPLTADILMGQAGDGGNGYNGMGFDAAGNIFAPVGSRPVGVYYFAICK